MEQPIIVVDNLVRRYGDFTAVNRISFSVGKGEIFGFLGPNGAGKTTTISVLCTLLKPSEGKAIVAGHDVLSDSKAVRQSIGLVFQESTLDEQLTAEENLRFHAALYHLPLGLTKKRMDEVLEMVDLADRRRDLVKAFSGGMRRRLEIARGLLHHPRILFLDEPTLGLDPQTRRHIWTYLLNLQEQEGVTIFLTTHYMDEAEFASRIAIIDHGRIVALDTPEGLKSMVGGDVITVHTQDDETARRFAQEQFGARLLPGSSEGGFALEVEDGASFIPQFVRGVPPVVKTISLRRPTLDDVFLKLTGRQIRDGELDAKDQFRQSLKNRKRRRPH